VNQSQAGSDVGTHATRELLAVEDSMAEHEDVGLERMHGVEQIEGSAAKRGSSSGCLGHVEVALGSFDEPVDVLRPDAYRYIDVGCRTWFAERGACERSSDDPVDREFVEHGANLTC
jgi:hypothetical protein